MDKSLIPFYFSFNGRATRRDFNIRFLLVWFLGWVAAGLLDLIFAGGYRIGMTGEGPFSSIWSLLTMIPMFALTCRRLHDLNRSGWWQLAIHGASIIIIGIIAATVGTSFLLNPLVAGLAGVIALIFFAVMYIGFFILLSVKRGTRGPNKYGPDPLEVIE